MAQKRESRLAATGGFSQNIEESVNNRSLTRNSTTQEILSAVKASDVYRALTGREARRTGRDNWRAAAIWRGGDGESVSIDDTRGVWHDFVSNEGGGVLDLVAKIRGGSRQDALHWCAEYAGLPLEDSAISDEDRARWAAQRRETDRNLPSARYWKRAAIAMGEDLQDLLKAGLFDPTASPRPEIGEIAGLERMLSRLRGLDGDALVQEYLSWRSDYPGLVAGMVRSAQSRERAERNALRTFITGLSEEGTAA
ncbi:MAG TPA: hypothetical protein VKU19_14875 [Bryobacteraceae bacterium]|nr:hypothetical protein [Bryobacteraceae bacterium]